LDSEGVGCKGRIAVGLQGAVFADVVQTGSMIISLEVGL